jgi:glycosyltransferase involved in cell wall biosynthesis/SAM-dependent methyltransferase
MNGCTIIARNYVAHARVLAESFFEHHPDGDFSVLVIDADQPPALRGQDRFKWLTPAQIGMDEREFHRMAMIYDVMELATAVKPSFLRHLLDSGTDAVYFDPDIEIFQHLGDISRLAEEHSIVLIPHTTDPLPHDRREPGEVTLLLAGMYNLGFIALGQGSRPFLDWWSERVARDCLVAPQQGQFVDQRWVDFVPTLFDHYVLRDPGCNVAHWNLETRKLEWADGRYSVNGSPLRFFHYSGFDPKRPYLLSKFLGRSPSILLSEEPALARICSDYAERLFASGYADWIGEPYAHDELPSGMPIDRRMRRLYRTALLEAERNGTPEPPDPFDAESAAAFIEWLREPAHESADATPIPRYLHALWLERPDLQAAFPDPRWVDGNRFLEWALTSGRREEQIPVELVPEPGGIRRSERGDAGRKRPEGVNLAGYFRAEVGTGEAARLLLAGVKEAGIPFSIVSYARTPSRQEHPFEAESAERQYGVNIICVNADQLPTFTYDVGPSFFRGRYSVGVWWWEVGRLLETHHDAFEIVDEIWAASDFVASALSAETSKPVLTLPLGVEIPEGAPVSREQLGLPENFLFLFSFDFLSVFERKNPLDLVAAFKHAFRPGEGPMLLLKSINGDQDLHALECLRAAADRPDILVVDEYMSADKKNALMSACDCYVSLHRSEGLGLTMAEAMARGKPVIATEYSGNLDFMSRDNSYLVPCTLVPIPEGCDPYPAGAEWAQPDVEAAARLMRLVFTRPEEAKERGRRASEDIRLRRSPSVTAGFLRSRLSEIRDLRRGRASPLPSVQEAAPPAHGSKGLARAADYVAHEPMRTLSAPSRFGPSGRFARRVLYRLLRPRTVPQRLFEAAVVDALANLHREGEQLGERFDEASRRVDETAEAARMLRLELERGRAHHDRALSAFSQDVIRHLDALETRGKTMEEYFETLAERLGGLDAEISRVAGSLEAEPFLADRELLRIKDAHGREALGYVDGGGEAASEKLYLEFENIFRGSEPLIRERQQVYLDYVEGREPVLDVGCGRGEFLDLLREKAIDAKGIDIDAGMVSHCREKGHDVELADATAYLSDVSNGSLGAIFSSQVIEHLPYEKLLHLLELSNMKLASNGIFIAETVNPHSVSALKTFWVDPTHRSPIFPEVALALCRLRGFPSAVIVFPNGTGDFDRDRRESGEYALIAYRGEADVDARLRRGRP